MSEAFFSDKFLLSLIISDKFLLSLSKSIYAERNSTFLPEQGKKGGGKAAKKAEAEAAALAAALEEAEKLEAGALNTSLSQRNPAALYCIINFLIANRCTLENEYCNWLSHALKFCVACLHRERDRTPEARGRREEGA